MLIKELDSIYSGDLGGFVYHVDLSKFDSAYLRKSLTLHMAKIPRSKIGNEAKQDELTYNASNNEWGWYDRDNRIQAYASDPGILDGTMLRQVFPKQGYEVRVTSNSHGISALLLNFEAECEPGVVIEFPASPPSNDITKKMACVGGKTLSHAAVITEKLDARLQGDIGGFFYDIDLSVFDFTYLKRAITIHKAQQKKD